MWSLALTLGCSGLRGIHGTDQWLRAPGSSGPGRVRKTGTEWGPNGGRSPRRDVAGPSQPRKDCCWSSAREHTGLRLPRGHWGQSPRPVSRNGSPVTSLVWERFREELDGLAGEGFSVAGRTPHGGRWGDLRAQRSPLVPAVWPQSDRFFPRPEDPHQWVLMPVSRGCGEGLERPCWDLPGGRCGCGVPVALRRASLRLRVTRVLRGCRALTGRAGHLKSGPFLLEN